MIVWYTWVKRIENQATQRLILVYRTVSCELDPVSIGKMHTHNQGQTHLRPVPFPALPDAANFLFLQKIDGCFLFLFKAVLY